VVKPTRESNFDYKAVAWADLAEAETPLLMPDDDTLAPVA
jgi:hypothetical protein